MASQWILTMMDNEIPKFSSKPKTEKSEPPKEVSPKTVNVRPLVGCRYKCSRDIQYGLYEVLERDNHNLVVHASAVHPNTFHCSGILDKQTNIISRLPMSRFVECRRLGFSYVDLTGEPKLAPCTLGSTKVEILKETSKESSKESPKESPKEPAKVTSKETPKDFSKEARREILKTIGEKFASWNGPTITLFGEKCQRRIETSNESVTFKDIEGNISRNYTPTLNCLKVWDMYAPDQHGTVTVLMKAFDENEIFLLNMDPEKLNEMVEMFITEKYEFNIIPLLHVNADTLIYDQGEFMNEFLERYFGFQFVRKERGVVDKTALHHTWS